MISILTHCVFLSTILFEYVYKKMTIPLAILEMLPFLYSYFMDTEYKALIGYTFFKVSRNTLIVSSAVEPSTTSACVSLSSFPMPIAIICALLIA